MRNPSNKKNRKKIHTSILKEYEFDHNEMDFESYSLLLKLLDSKEFKTIKEKRLFINNQIPGKSNLWQSFISYKKIYEKKNKAKKKQILLDRINENIDNMEEARQYGLSVRKKRTKSEDNNKYQVEFDFLDSNIDKIEVLIYLGASPTRICQDLCKFCRGLNPIIFHRWSDSTEHIDRIIYATKKAGENYIHLGKDFLLDWLDPTKHPELDMQHVGIVREVSLYYSRMAEFSDRKKYGKKVEIVDDKEQKKILEGKDLLTFLSGLDDIAGKINNNNNDKSEGEYTDYEEEV